MAVNKVVLVGGPHPGAEVGHAGRWVTCLCHRDDGKYELHSITQAGPPHVLTYTWSQAPGRTVQEEIEWR